MRNQESQHKRQQALSQDVSVRRSSKQCQAKRQMPNGQAQKKLRTSSKVAAGLVSVAAATCLLWALISISQKQSDDNSFVGGNLEAVVSDVHAPSTNEASSASVQEASSGIRVTTGHCPIPLASCEDVFYEKGSNIESWSTTANMPCNEYATELLIELRDEGYSLTKADFLDLYGQAWGCVVRSSENETYIIALTSKRMGSSSDGVDCLNVSVVHMFTPVFSEADFVEIGR